MHDDVQAPCGDFVIHPEDARLLVLLAGEIGITPLLSVVNSVIASGKNRDVWLFYGVRNGSEHFMKQHLQQLNAARERLYLYVVYSEPAYGEVPVVDYHRNGYLSVEQIRKSIRVCNFDFFVCRPPPMMQRIVPALLDWGVAENRIHTEAFGPATLQKTTSAAQPAEDNGRQHNPPAATVEFSRTGCSALWDGQSASLLDFALSNGVAMKSECRAGSCGSCEVTIRQGRFSTLGESCLTCISVPDSQVVLDACCYVVPNASIPLIFSDS
jgi:Na+-transporting NADH:ubiquinone oxidoreductase subunit NqrF